MLTGSLWDKKLPIKFTSEISSLGKSLTIKAYLTESTEDYTDKLPTGINVTAEAASGVAGGTEMVMTADMSLLTVPGTYYFVVIADEEGPDQVAIAQVEAEITGLDGFTQRIA